jgi:hypothetical protein
MSIYCIPYLLLYLLLFVHTENDPLALHPLFALEWFRRLLVACAGGYRDQREGSLCSVMPADSPCPASGGDGTVGVLAAELVSDNATMLQGHKANIARRK